MAVSSGRAPTSDQRRAEFFPLAVTQLLIVHRDPEIGRDLVQLVKDYTGYESVLTNSESETLVWLRRQPEVRPQILLTQLQAPGLDGFILGASLGEMFPGLQTLFLPASPGVETVSKKGNALLLDALEEGRRRALPAWRHQIG